MTSRISLALATALLVPTLLTGCDLGQQSAIVDVFAASHGTPDANGNLPTRNGDQLIFVNDLGWDIFVDEAYVTTSAATLEACTGASFDVEFYWGPLAEDIGATADLESEGLGGVRADAGTYCDVVVEYAPNAEEVENPAAVGSTVYMTGSAVKDGVLIPFLWRSEIAVEVRVDISQIEAGSAFEITDEEYFSKKLTVSKSYDRFFDGIDFANELSQADIDALVAASLVDGTTAEIPQ